MRRINCVSRWLLNPVVDFFGSKLGSMRRGAQGYPSIPLGDVSDHLFLSTR